MSEVAKHLKVCLANTYGLYLKTQNYHWNIKGPHFFSYHTFLESIYTDLAKDADVIAERIVALGEVAPGSFHAFMALMTYAEAPEDVVSAKEMLADLLDSFNNTLDSFSTALQIAKDSEDSGTEDLLGSLIGEHEKKAWMVRAHLS